MSGRRSSPSPQRSKRHRDQRQSSRTQDRQDDRTSSRHREDRRSADRYRDDGKSQSRYERDRNHQRDTDYRREEKRHKELAFDKTDIPIERERLPVLSSTPNLDNQTNMANNATMDQDANGNRSFSASGLKIEIHPLLAKGTGSSTSLLPRQTVATAKANIRAAELASQSLLDMKPRAGKRLLPSKEQGIVEDATSRFLSLQPEDPAVNNLYYDHRLATITAKNLASRHGPRPLKFHQKGKFVSQANQLRMQLEMEQLKREIAESAKTAGVDVELIADRLATSVEQVPLVEWWDIPFVSASGKYSTDSIVYDGLNNLIQRPALIPPPIDPNITIAPKPLILTKEEQKKLRRQRRLEAQRERQDLIKAGLIPPDKPRLKIANLTKALANESVAEPSKMEAEVRAEIEIRRQQHEQLNAERQLTEEERLAKKWRKHHPDLTGQFVHVGVFVLDAKVNIVDVPQWRFKISMNAQQSGLTGCIMMTAPAIGGMAVVVVEGSLAGLKRYKHLLLERIDWTKRPEEKALSPTSSQSGSMMQIEKLELATGDDTTTKHCQLIWEGLVKERSFKRFETKQVSSELDAIEYFSQHQVEHYWKLARSN